MRLASTDEAIRSPEAYLFTVSANFHCNLVLINARGTP
jgi:hypothetical protein